MNAIELQDLEQFFEKLSFDTKSQLSYFLAAASDLEDQSVIKDLKENLDFLQIEGKSAPQPEHFLKNPEAWLQQVLPHPQRQREWLLGRKALLALKHKHPSLTPLDCSLTHHLHPNGVHLALGAASLNQSLSLGVDLESTSRSLSPRLQKRLITETESQLHLSPIEFWTIKEACFKAFRHHPAAVITEFQVLSWNEATRSGHLSKKASPNSRARYWLFSSPQYVVSVVLTSRSP